MKITFRLTQWDLVVSGLEVRGVGKKVFYQLCTIMMMMWGTPFFASSPSTRVILMSLKASTPPPIFNKRLQGR